MASSFIFADKVATLTEVLKPATIVVDKDQFYVTEGTTVYIYSLKDFKYKKKFGKPGEGPQEFKVRPTESVEVIPQKDQLMINSLQKIAFYTKDGIFKREIRTKASYILPYCPLGKNFTGFGFRQENKKNYLTLNIYDSNLKKIKEFHKTHLAGQGGGKIDAVAATKRPVMHTFNNKIFAEGENGSILVFDNNGKKLLSIKDKYKKIKVTQDRIKRYLDFFKTDPRTRQAYEAYKDRVIFPDYFPIIRNYNVSDQKIYIVTFKEDGEKREFYIYDFNGKLIKRTMLPLIELTAIEISPYTIKNNVLYQIIENEDDEEWELYITKIL